MAVLVEAISVVIRADRLLQAYGGYWDCFRSDVPNQTLCADDKIVRVGFMVPADVQKFVALLGKRGLVYLKDGAALDMVVVDQQRGPMVPCDWLEFGRVTIGGGGLVAAGRLKGDDCNVLITPNGWTFDNSLSKSFGFVPNEAVARLDLLRKEDGIEVYAAS
jgi:hypothetical protein